MKLSKEMLDCYGIYEMMIENKWSDKALIIDGSVWNLYIVRGELKAAKKNEFKTTEYSKLPKYIKAVIDRFEMDKIEYKKQQAINEIKDGLKELEIDLWSPSFFYGIDTVFKNKANDKVVKIELYGNYILFGNREFSYSAGDIANLLYVIYTNLKDDEVEAKPEIKVFEEIGAEAKHIDTKVVDGQEIKKWAVLDDPMDRRIFTHNGKLIATFHTWPQFEEWYYGQKKLTYSGGW